MRLAELMTKGDPKGKIVLSNLHTNNIFVFLFTIEFLIFSFKFRKEALRC